MAQLRLEDYFNKQYERLTVIGLVLKPYRERQRTFFICECECGNVKEILANDVKRGKIYSCGCLHRESTIKRSTRHGQCHTRLYGIWASMVQRCENPQNERYSDYGGRGIRVCESWHDFSNFSKWAYDNGYDENASYGKCTIERNNNNKDYSPDNCCFATMAEQNKNQRIRKDNTSGRKGISYVKQVDKWHAYIASDGKQISLGYHNTKEAAVNARTEGELKYW